MFCAKCGKEINDEAVVCVHCGCATSNKMPVQPSDKTFIATLLFCLFLGGVGAHRFYTGHIGSAVAQLLMCITIVLSPITAIWVLIDFIAILTGGFKTSTGQELAK